jgi:hypothetical protein
MRVPTEAEIREEVYTNTFQETGSEIEVFINGSLWVLEKWAKANEAEANQRKEAYIYERDDDSIRRRKFMEDR